MAALCALVLLGSCATQPLSRQQVSLETLTDEMGRKAQLVSRFEAVFIKTRRSAVFNRDLTVKGHLVFQRPDRFRLVLSGDVNVEILSNGKWFALIHDGRDEETFDVEGDRDLSRFSDPLMLLIDALGNGGLSRFSVLRQEYQDDGLMVELKPSPDYQFERISTVMVWFAGNGQIRKVNIRFTNGNEDETVFESWSMLAQDSPAVLTLEKRLQEISREEDAPSAQRIGSGDLSMARDAPAPEPSNSQVAATDKSPAPPGSLAD